MATPLAPEDAVTLPPAFTFADTAVDFGAGNFDDEFQLLLPVDFFARVDLPGDPATEGMRQIARSLEENVGLQQILNTTEALETPEPVAGAFSQAAPAARAVAELPNGSDERSTILPENIATALAPGGPRPGAVASAAAALPPADPTRTASGAEIPVTDPESLRSVLRSLAGNRHVEIGPDQANAAAEDSGEGTALGLGQAALDSRILGEALDAFIRRSDGSSFDPTFSLLGLGEFSLQTSGNLHTVALTEANTGASVTLLQDSPAIPQERQPAQPQQKVDLLTLVLGFLATPTGTLTAIAGSIVIIVWAMVRMATGLRRR